MQITLNNTEIESAIVDYIDKQGISLNNAEVDVALVAGRGPNGHTANVNIDKTTAKTVSAPKKRSFAAVRAVDTEDKEPEDDEVILSDTDEDAEAVEEEESDDTETEDEPVPSKSLFGT